MKSSTKVIAHRGAFKTENFPENSIAALNNAIDLKCYGVEFDIHLTADNQMVVFHDSDFMGLKIELSNYTDLLNFKLSNSEKIPTLEEYISFGIEKKSSIMFICELKALEINVHKNLFFAEKVYQTFKNFNALNKVVFICFNYDILLKFHQLNPKLPTQYLNGDKTPKELKNDRITGINYHYSVYFKNPNLIVESKQNQLAINVWTVNEKSEIEWCLNNEFDFITTNEPEYILKILNE